MTTPVVNAGRARAGWRGDVVRHLSGGYRGRASCSGSSASRPVRSRRWTPIRQPRGQCATPSGAPRGSGDRGTRRGLRTAGAALARSRRRHDLHARRADPELGPGPGLDERLDPDEVHRLLSGLEALPPEVEETMRSSGHYGPASPSKRPTRRCAYSRSWVERSDVVHATEIDCLATHTLASSPPSEPTGRRRRPGGSGVRRHRVLDLRARRGGAAPKDPHRAR